MMREKFTQDFDVVGMDKQVKGMVGVENIDLLLFTFYTNLDGSVIEMDIDVSVAMAKKDFDDLIDKIGYKMAPFLENVLGVHGKRKSNVSGHFAIANTKDNGFGVFVGSGDFAPVDKTPVPADGNSLIFIIADDKMIPHLTFHVFSSLFLPPDFLIDLQDKKTQQARQTQ